MRFFRDYALWPLAGLLVFWTGYAIAVETASARSYYCAQTIGVIQWPAIAYLPVSLVGPAVTSWWYPAGRRIAVVAWNVSATAGVLFLSYLAAFGGVGPDNCALT